MNILQNFIFPESRVCTEQRLYFSGHGLAGDFKDDCTIHLAKGGLLASNSYFNAFNIDKWDHACALDGLFLTLKFSGSVELKVMVACVDKSWEVLQNRVLTSDGKKPTRIDISNYTEHAASGLIFFELIALKETVFYSAQYATKAAPHQDIKLAICITTFRREKEVQDTVRRLDSFLKGLKVKSKLHIFVVDNGQSAKIKNSASVTYMKNANLGGSGGFARGLQEAEAAGFSHCLFMDDDASFHMENILRTYMFLALAKNPKTALAGAMISNTHKWAMWENGAFFDRTCHPMFTGFDLRDFGKVREIEVESAKPPPKGFYGGWWYFAFQIDQVKYRPFPFFVRGDDVNFSLSNDFEIYTLNGLVSFQDDFFEKETPQTIYLDMRSHLVHHLSIAKMDIGAKGSAKIALWFISRAIVRCHYETAQVLLLSWNDVMQGPKFFADNADMIARRKSIGAMVHNEKWIPAEDLEPKHRFRWDPNRKRLIVLLLKYTLNGHLLPLYKLYANRVKVSPLERNNLFPVWGASRMTYYTRGSKRGYTVEHSKPRFARLMWQVIKASVKFIYIYPKLSKDYRSEHVRMTSKAFWQEKFKDHNG